MQQETKPNFWALLPLIVFLSIYLIASIIMGDFYKMPITVAFLVSSVVAVAISSGGKLHKRIDLFCKGAANSNIMLMVWIFILAGAFAQTAKYNPQIEMFARFKMKSSFHKTKRII